MGDYLGDKMNLLQTKIFSWLWFMVVVVLFLLGIFVYSLDHFKFLPAGYGDLPTNRFDVLSSIFFIVFILPFFLKTILFYSSDIFRQVPFRIIYFILPKNKSRTIDLLLSLFIITIGVVSLIRGLIN
jgi:hypothetical protein